MQMSEILYIIIWSSVKNNLQRQSKWSFAEKIQSYYIVKVPAELRFIIGSTAQ